MTHEEFMSKCAEIERELGEVKIGIDRAKRASEKLAEAVKGDFGSREMQAKLDEIKASLDAGAVLR